MRFLRYTLILAILLSLPILTRADLIFTLDQPIQSGKPGDILNFTGTLINLNGPTLYLTGDTFTLDGVGLTLDDTPFLINAPASLDSGDSFTGTLFTVAIDPSALPQISEGGFQILGGNFPGDQTTLANKDFLVNVVPEPGSAALLAGLLGTTSLCWRRRVRR